MFFSSVEVSWVFFLFIGSALLGGSSVQKWKEDQIFVVNAIGFFCILYIE